MRSVLRVQGRSVYLVRSGNTVVHGPNLACCLLANEVLFENRLACRLSLAAFMAQGQC